MSGPRSLRDDFAALLADSGRTDLARAALEIARIGHPNLEVAPWLDELGAMAAEVRGRLPSGSAPREAAATVAAYLFQERGYRGNRDDFYDPCNSFLNDVLVRRLGIPITLSVLFLDVARRVGLHVEGVGFPGHFLVRAIGSDGPVLLDPFFGGEVVSRETLLARLRALAGPRARGMTEVPARFLDPTGTPDILARMLRNLLQVYLARDDAQHALPAADCLLVLDPGSAELLRIRGALHEQLECFGTAIDDLRAALAGTPDGPTAEDIRARITRLTRRPTTLH